MNSKVFNLLLKNLKKQLNLPKYDSIRDSINSCTSLDDIMLTPAKRHKFESSIKEELEFDDIDFTGSLEEITNRLDSRYTGRFFSQIWKPNTDSHKFTGWNIVDQVNQLSPRRVLDYGCGYNQFKEHIPGLIGIDPYNESADYMVDIFEFVDDVESFDVILILGSLNFNSYEDIESRFAKIVSFLKPGGKVFFRANPGIQWPNGPYVDIFAWSFKFASELGKKYNMHIETYKKDPGANGERLYFVYEKLS